MTKEQFNAITEWQYNTFQNASALSSVEHLIHEVQELKYDIKTQAPFRGLEYADCLFLVFGAAKADGFDYDDIIRFIDLKFHINKNRKWGVPDKKGVVNHIK